MYPWCTCIPSQFTAVQVTPTLTVRYSLCLARECPVMLRQQQAQCPGQAGPPCVAHQAGRAGPGLRADSTAHLTCNLARDRGLRPNHASSAHHTCTRHARGYPPCAGARASPRPSAATPCKRHLIVGPAALAGLSCQELTNETGANSPPGPWGCTRECVRDAQQAFDMRCASDLGKALLVSVI